MISHSSPGRPTGISASTRPSSPIWRRYRLGMPPLGVRRAGSQAPVDTRNGEYVSGNFFRTLGIQPWIGRLMTDDDDREGAAPVAVMSYHIWNDKYGSDPSVVGASYQINGHPFTVIGVAPPGFFGAKLAAGACPIFGFRSPPNPAWRRSPAPQTTERELARHPRPSAPRRECQNARSEAQGRVPGLARQPCARYGARRKTDLAPADAPSHSGRRWSHGHARSI